MEYDGLTEYLRKRPEVDQIGLVSEFTSPVVTSFRCRTTAVGHSGGPSLPPFVQHRTWRLERRESFRLSHLSLRQMMNSLNPKANILIDEDGHARLTNFGLASVVLGNQSITSIPDTSLTASTMWPPPEGGSVTKAGDVFTFAMVAAEVCTRWVFERSFSTYSPRTDLHGAFPTHRILQCSVEWGSAYTTSNVEGWSMESYAKLLESRSGEATNFLRTGRLLPTTVSV